VAPQLFYCAHEQRDGEVESAVEAAQSRRHKAPALMTVQGMAQLERELLGACLSLQHRVSGQTLPLG
jgi:hypothetical protein